jgi:RNA polymerase sigma-70 factor (ECF subfamily)
MNEESNQTPKADREPPEVAIPRLMDAHGGRIYALARRICGDAHEADDLVQEIFMNAFRSWEQFDGRSEPTAWLYTIATRACQRMHRRRAGQPERIESLDAAAPFNAARIAVVPDPAETPLDEQLRRERRERVESAIAQLHADYRMPLILKDIAELSVRDVATVLGLSESAVRVRVHRARLKLRESAVADLPRAELPPPAYERQVCMDLLQAKQDALDRGTDFPLASSIVCERCRAVFASLDLTHDVCVELGRGGLPDAVRQRFLAEITAN